MISTKEQATINDAIAILARECSTPAEQFTSPAIARQYLTVKLASQQRENFGAVLLNAQNGVLAVETLFVGTLTEVAVYPREVVRVVLQHNAAAVILFHNHPSGQCQPSDADERLTKKMDDVLEMIDVKLLDHFIIGGTSSFSFAEHGLI